MIPTRTVIVRGHAGSSHAEAPEARVTLPRLPWEREHEPPDPREETRPRVLPVRSRRARAIRSIDDIEDAPESAVPESLRILDDDE